jgi:hypothetical protein
MMCVVVCVYTHTHTTTHNHTHTHTRTHTHTHTHTDTKSRKTLAPEDEVLGRCSNVEDRVPRALRGVRIRVPGLLSRPEPRTMFSRLTGPCGGGGGGGGGVVHVCVSVRMCLSKVCVCVFQKSVP